MHRVGGSEQGVDQLGDTHHRCFFNWEDEDFLCSQSNASLIENCFLKDVVVRFLLRILSSSRKN